MDGMGGGGRAQRQSCCSLLRAPTHPRPLPHRQTHFGRFTGQYHAGTYLFDIHPPLGKLVFWAVGKATGYDHTKCAYVNIGDAYGPECHFMTLRAVAAAFGTAIVPVMYFIARYWRLSTAGAALAAVLLCFDGLNLVESRLILMDSQLMFW
jgi:dolichyl-phosphate-mannose-protein mannosyltransferase